MNILFIHLFKLPKPIFPHEDEVFCFVTVYICWSCISTEKLQLHHWLCDSSWVLCAYCLCLTNI